MQHLARFDDPRRYGTLVAVLLEASSTLTDEILDLHDRFVGSIFNKARRRRDEAFQSSGKAINEKVRLYARIGQALLAAKEHGADPFAAIEKIVSWVEFARTVSEAEQLAQPEDFDFLGLISNGFPQMRRYTPAMLDIFEFRAAPAAQPLLEVIDILRTMNRDKSRSVPQNAPSGVDQPALATICCHGRGDRPPFLRAVCTDGAEESPAFRRCLGDGQPSVQGLRGIPSRAFALHRTADETKPVTAGRAGW